MKGFIKLMLVSLALISLKSYAVVFTCKGIVYDLYSNGNNSYEVRFKRESGVDLEPVIIYPEQHYLLAPVLDAIREGEKYRTVYRLVIENRDSADTRCHDGESENALIGLTKVID
ncbi:hypothetical protein L3V43_08080 [Pseudoalteromonas sp. L23]|uniref:hypothetical protein n=1 Tax=unclassified Pseudoalteromonas TaxID=194690 RepID=UPI001F35C9E4|nr:MULTISPECIES: hypothetical protein [unclassified Pseudoalteromonas]MCF2826142.1 hypothetical protein [Pseudoalteromonas sp. OF5H-5]MCF2833582.1 hypothetical protein [Pseudoalteromonas sp. DL2-H6]MCF2924909.1 hypothetical protein [Pseudoalteromonas sp. DL2-H1]MCF7513413.1 hypothetical protein [Pseudoalteromonas sp. L7]MCF7525610.1 hypothetical protein [Pseudoalteromonas sp. L23]